MSPGPSGVAIGPRPPMPAQLTSRWTGPATCAAAACTACQSPTSQAIMRAPSGGLPARSSETTSAPEASSAPAVARPSPELPPVTTASLPAGSITSPAACRATLTTVTFEVAPRQVKQRERALTTREGLYAALDRFKEALAARDPAQVGWSPDLLYTENNVALDPGDGLWGTLTALGPYDLRFADASHGQVALFTCVEETDATSPCAIRLRLREGAIAECEIVVARNKDEGFPFLGQKFEDKPAMLAEVPEAERATREELVRIANGYFETIERNDGTIRTRFHPHCNR